MRSSTGTHFLRQLFGVAVVTSIRAEVDVAAVTWAHAAEAFLATRSRAQAWSAGTVVKYRQTVTDIPGA